MNARLALAGVLALAIAVAGLVVATRPGSGVAESAQLAFTGKPRIVRPPELPRDRILSVRLENTGLKDVKLDVRDVEVLDSRGRELRSSVRFATVFAHGLVSPREQVGDPGEFERRRLGELVTLKPRRSAPLTVSWRGRVAELRVSGERLKLSAN